MSTCKCMYCMYGTITGVIPQANGTIEYQLVCENGVSPEDKECCMNGANIVIFAPSTISKGDK